MFVKACLIVLTTLIAIIFDQPMRKASPFALLAIKAGLRRPFLRLLLNAGCSVFTQFSSSVFNFLVGFATFITSRVSTIP